MNTLKLGNDLLQIIYLCVTLEPLNVVTPSLVPNGREYQHAHDST